MHKLGIIGDIHGKGESYKRLIRDCEYSVQVGDMGFDYGFLNDIDSTHHRFIPGNHDNYNCLPPHSLGDYGLWTIPSFELFFVRGAWSIDYKYRTLGVDLFEEEELSVAQFDKCIELYSKLRPDFVISHSCPLEIVGKLKLQSGKVVKTRTVQALQAMFEIHQPTLWIFGHYHQTFRTLYKGTMFICVDSNAGFYLR